MNRNWRVRPSNLSLSRNLIEHLDLAPLTAQILANRGIDTPEEGERFIRPSLSHLHAPLSMKDMDRAVDRMVKALENQEKVLIYGDYDVDGITATSILVTFLREIGMNPRYHIPHRIREGYGLNIQAIKNFKAEGIELLITTDCGISNQVEIQEAARLGMDTIVIDHHEVPENPPPAWAILNPKQKACAFPFNRLAGVGVTFQLLIAFRAKLREKGFWSTGETPNLRKYLDLVALGTISDVVPLIDENRVLVRYGLEELSSGSRVGIKAIKELCGLDGKTINSGHVAFQLSPRLNASGRLDEAAVAVELLTTNNLDEARQIASRLKQLNDQRQCLEDQIMSEIVKDIKARPEILASQCLFFSSPRWHPGVIGIVASRLVERFGKPSVLISINESLGKGSARSIDGLDLYAALQECHGLLNGFGGHRMAAGFTVGAESIEALRGHFEMTISRQCAEKVLKPGLWIDAEVRLVEINHRLLDDLRLLEPYGMGNPRPLFLSKGVAVCEARTVGADSLKMRVRDEQVFDAIGYRMGDLLPLSSRRIDMVFTPQITQWRGSRRIELEVKDLIPHVVE